MIRRSTRSEAAALALLFLSVLGCGETEPAFDPATRYSPESLGAELVLQYKSLDPAHRDVVRPRSASAGKAAGKKSQAQTKQAEAATLDDLVRETVAKAATIPNLPATQAIAQVAEAIEHDPAIAEADRKTIVDRLRAAGGAKSPGID